MENKHLIKYKETFITKIKNFFRKFFKSKRKQTIPITEEINVIKKEETSKQKENEFFNEIKVNNSNIDEFVNKKNFLEYIDGNVEALNLLSIDRLKKLEEYYDKVINENEAKIKSLKN